jgi:hypothetical protein
MMVDGWTIDGNTRFGLLLSSGPPIVSLQPSSKGSMSVAVCSSMTWKKKLFLHTGLSTLSLVKYLVILG